MWGCLSRAHSERRSGEGERRGESEVDSPPTSQETYRGRNAFSPRGRGAGRATLAPRALRSVRSEGFFHDARVRERAVRRARWTAGGAARQLARHSAPEQTGGAA